ncbi:hypothetical protein ACTHPH_07695 [Paenibacillus pasadenensis]
MLRQILGSAQVLFSGAISSSRQSLVGMEDGMLAVCVIKKHESARERG